jgi:thiopeptide-type bacteriocin biosynthesis protein
MRFLCEITRSHTAVYMPFSWGAARALPRLPRLRYGRAILTVARWNLSADDLPDRHTAWPRWTDAVTRWRSQLQVPNLVHLVEADNLLRLDLTIDAHLALLRMHLDRHGRARLDEAPPASAYGWIDGHAHEIVIPLARTEPSRRPPAVVPRAVNREHGHLPCASPWLYAKLYTHADLLPHLADMFATWDEPPLWWYLPYLDPHPHVRLRIRLSDQQGHGYVAQRIGAWTTAMRQHGLLGRVQWDTYYPETGRYGFEAALDAAEAVFAVDTTAVIAQHDLVHRDGISPDAITVASLVDLAAAFSGSTLAGMHWLAEKIPHRPIQVDRTLRDAALQLADPTNDWAALRATTAGPDVLANWRNRRTAMAQYRSILAHQRDALTVLPSLLHLHQVRMVGLSPDREARSLKLARAAAVRWTRTVGGTA